MLDFTGSYTDQYQLAMGQVYFLKRKNRDIATFDYFFRKLPYKGGFAVFAGLENLLEVLETLRFDEKDIDFLKSEGFHPEYLDYLKEFNFTGKIYSFREGDVVFQTEPIVRVEAPIIEAQIIETFLLNILNFQTLVATKARRISLQAKGRTLIDFGLRRAQATGGYYASRAAVIGGFIGTSNTRAGRDFGISVSGTMSHSFIQSYENELTAFQEFAEINPDNSVLLVDTYNTLKSGVPNAILVGKQMQKKGLSLKAVRLDSGDLAYLSRKTRQMLDNAGLHEVKIAVSNQLDEFLIKSLLEQDAPIDIFGVGTNLVTGKPDGALDGVYKLADFNNQPSIKLSETIEKVTLPHKKQVFRILDENGNFIGADVITVVDETAPSKMLHPFDPLKTLILEGYEKEPLLNLVMDKGKRTTAPQTLEQIKVYSEMRLAKLPMEYKRFFNPHIYKIGLSNLLKQERDKIIKEHKINASL